MERKVFAAGPEHEGKTVLRLVHDLGGFSHAETRGLLASGAIRRNGAAVSRPDERLRRGDAVEIRFEPSRRYHAPPRPKTEGYRVVHEDDDVVIVDKDAGLLTVPTPSSQDDSLAEILAAAYRARGHRRPLALPVHRIDRYTSGLVAFARNRTAWAALRRQFSAGLPERVYVAVATGRIARERGVLEHYLEEHPKSLKVRAAAEGRRAVCSYRVLERLPHATVVEVRLETGRRNQIRVQLAALGHALVGDHTYGTASDAIDRTALHAARLAFDHPASGRRIEASSPLPRDFEKLLGRLRAGEAP